MTSQTSQQKMLDAQQQHARLTQQITSLRGQLATTEAEALRVEGRFLAHQENAQAEAGPGAEAQAAPGDGPSEAGPGAFPGTQGEAPVPLNRAARRHKPSAGR